MSGLIRLERPVHYGNTGRAFSESRHVDDAYIFKPENTRDVWSHCRSMTDRYGLSFHFDESGDAILETRNNPHAVRELATSDVSGTPTTPTNPNAYAGTYLEWTGTVSLFTITVTAARIDLMIPTGPGLGSWTVTVRRLGTPVSTLTINPDNTATDNANLFFYDFRSTTDGTNATVATLYTGYYQQYTVDFQSSGGSGGTLRRLDALALWHTDPHNPLFPQALSTSTNALQVQARSAMGDMRNYVIVVGRRRAVVTDSSKLDTNPENPGGEFVVASGVDRRSVVNPFQADNTTATQNFLGWPKESLIFDSGVTDQDFAEYLARTFIYRQRLPAPSAQITHTLLPAVQLGDPVYVQELTYDTVTSQRVLYVTAITHEVSSSGATTNIETTAYPAFPSYEAREDIDIDGRFNGQPVINVNIGYRSCTYSAKNNLVDGVQHLSLDYPEPAGDIVLVSARAVTGNALVMNGDPWPPVPGTVFLEVPTSAVPSGVLTTVPTTGTSPTGSQGGAQTKSLYVTVEGLTGVPLVYLDCVVNSGTSGTSFTVPVLATAPPASGGPYYYVDVAADKIIVFPGGKLFSGRGVDIGLNTVKLRVQYYKRTVGESALKVLANTPYHHYMEVNHRTANSPTGRRIELPWRHGDENGLYARDINTFDVRYRRLGPVDGSNNFLDPYSGSSPFYDPYTSEIGNFVNIGFDALVSGLYRITICNMQDDTVAAYLTEPTANAADPEAHWQFLTAGAGKSFIWDGVDQVGTWNKRQSAGYASAAFGAFEQGQRPLVGGGFYAWNREERSAAGYAPLALISGQLNADGTPVYGQGTYSQWYVRWEVQSDRLQELYEASVGTASYAWLSSLTKTTPEGVAVRVVQSGGRGINAKLNETGVRGVGGTDYYGYIYMHLPKPTQVAVSFADWTGGLYDPTDTAAINNPSRWSSAPDADATLNNQKPVRVRFTVLPRPGETTHFWTTANQQEVDVKLFRHAHLRANIMDQFVIFEGTNYPGDATENRRVVSRRFTNDDHTVVFQDDTYRKAKTFKSDSNLTGTEWVFRPDEFRKNFRGTENEPIQFGDYLQLEEVPRWDTTGAVAGTRSRYQIGFMNYLFYLSVYTQDRSGRFTWCINPTFLDQSKITRNLTTDWADPANPTAWPLDMNTQFRRSMVTRQWTDELVAPGLSWIAAETARHSLPAVGVALLRHKWHDHSNTSTTLNGAAWPVLQRDDYSHWHATNGPGLPASFNNMTRQFASLGTWTWESAPLWKPCITRDFHGYYCLPPMIDKLKVDQGGINYRSNYIYPQVDGREYVNADQNKNVGDDAAASTVWNSPIRDMTEAYGGATRFWPGQTVVSRGTNSSGDAGILANTLDYERQDDLVHWEDCRGIYSRGPRPAEAPKKVQPAGPYYQNVHRSTGLWIHPAYQQEERLPSYRGNIDNWFRMAFRSEYLWESGTFFPTYLYGNENLQAVNHQLARCYPASQVAGNSVRLDGGAWVGWKDDYDATIRAYNPRGDLINIFNSKYMPLAVGPTTPQNRDMIFHMILLDERRGD